MNESVRNPDDPLAAIEREVLSDQLQAQREVLELEEYYWRRLMFAQPGLWICTLAGGTVAQDNLPGDERDAWNGVYVENPSGYTLAVGFATGGASGGGYLVPPGTWKLIPARFVHIAVGLVDQTQVNGPLARITVTRLRIPPAGVRGGPLSGLPLSLDDTLTNAGVTAAAPAAATTITQLTGLTPGWYRVDVVTYEPTTPDTNLANAQLNVGGVILGALPTTSVPIATAVPRVSVPPGPTNNFIRVRTGGSVGGAGAVYAASLAATRLA